MYIITDHQREDIIVEDKIIKVFPAYEWLLNTSGDLKSQEN